ncbi:transcriptional regulator [Mesorhizobium sp. ES1-3]|nr:transcriptional regulator [Mesorhizobium sp. ES1-3]
MTQEELPARSGLIARYISVLERADVSASVLGHIVDALGMEPEALIRKANGSHSE